MLSIVGESGSGKSVTAMTILGLTRGPNARISGSVRYQGKELTTASNEELQAIRGDRIAMVFQDPMSSFNPVQKIGDQIVEAILAHRDMGKAGRPPQGRGGARLGRDPATPRRAPSTTPSSSPAGCARGR